MAIAHAMWIHGHSVQIEHPDRLEWVKRRGFSILVCGKEASSNWFHFAIPTPVLVNGGRLRVGQAMVRFRCPFGGATVKKIRVYDDIKQIKLVVSKENLDLRPNNWHLEKVSVDVKDPKDPNKIIKPEIKWGLGISINVSFAYEDRQIAFSSAGCDFLPP